MPSTYSPSLRIELPGSGEQSGVWGTTTNNNLGTLLEQSIAGVQAITMTDANYTLSNYNGVSDEARKAVLVVSGTNAAVRDIIAPLTPKVYTIKNNTTGGFAIRIKASTGGSITIPNGATYLVYCDGTDFQLALTQTLVAAGTGISITTVGSTSTVSFGPITSAQLAAAVSDETGSGAAVFATSPTLVNPNLGTPTTLVGTNITGTAAGLSIGGNAATATTAAACTGNAATVTNGVYNNGGTYSINVTGSSGSCTGNAATVTNGVYNDGGTYSINVTGNAGGSSSSCTGNAATVTNGVYNNGGTYSINVTGNAGGSSSSCTGNSATATYAPLITGTAVTVSGATASFTGIPSWARRITILLSGVTTVAAGLPAIRAGSGSYEASGYDSVNNAIGASTVASSASATTSWDLQNSGGSANVYTGQVVITRVAAGTQYVVSGQVRYNTTSTALTVGTKLFSGTIDRVQLLMSTGTDTFNGGTMNIMWE
jgi:hypothetical protein